jgi:hypothetical protein
VTVDVTVLPGVTVLVFEREIVAVSVEVAELVIIESMRTTLFP